MNPPAGQMTQKCLRWPCDVAEFALVGKDNMVELRRSTGCRYRSVDQKENIVVYYHWERMSVPEEIDMVSR